MIEDQERLLTLAVDPEAKKKFAEDQKAWFDIEAKPLLEKSFKHHDTKNTDVLDKEEAAVFFAHVVHEGMEFIKAISALQLEAELKLFPKVLRQALTEAAGQGDKLDKETSEAVEVTVEEELKEQGKIIRQAIEEVKAEAQKKEE